MRWRGRRKLEDLTSTEKCVWGADAELEKRFLDATAEFAAGVGHELNNPLAVIRGLAQTLLRDETNVDKRRSLAAIIDQTVRAYEMITSIRAFSRPPKPELRLICADAFFTSWTSREKERLEGLNVECRIEGASSLEGVEFESDEAILSAILDAFGRNALDALRYKATRRTLGNKEATSLSDGRILCFARLFEDEGFGRRLAFGVEDDGEGLTPAARELAFSPFFSGRQAGRGLGVGLSRAQRFAEVLGGRVFCEDAVFFPTGCRQRIELPLLQEGALAKESLAAALTSKRSATRL